jgi:hypothetical protein
MFDKTINIGDALAGFRRQDQLKKRKAIIVTVLIVVAAALVLVLSGTSDHDSEYSPRRTAPTEQIDQ